jgi:hypothetical protein
LDDMYLVIWAAAYRLLDMYIDTDRETGTALCGVLVVNLGKNHPTISTRYEVQPRERSAGMGSRRWNSTSHSISGVSLF